MAAGLVLVLVAYLVLRAMTGFAPILLSLVVFTPLIGVR